MSLQCEAVSLGGGGLKNWPALIVGGVLFFVYPSTVQAQYTVCQTQTFWCAFPGSFPSGQACYCNSFYGPINGISINPTQYMPQPRDSRGGGEEEETIDIGEEAEDCLNGLGNCEGRFKSAVQKKKKRR
jgi:hypothetical protein